MNFHSLIHPFINSFIHSFFRPSFPFKKYKIGSAINPLINHPVIVQIIIVDLKESIFWDAQTAINLTIHRLIIKTIKQSCKNQAIQEQLLTANKSIKQPKKLSIDQSINQQIKLTKLNKQSTNLSSNQSKKDNPLYQQINRSVRKLSSNLSFNFQTTNQLINRSI